MEIDHIFIFSKNNGLEGDDLKEFGLTEGSNRIHKGQGTTNRKFYFKNFFLELLWVIDEDEIKQAPTKEIHLWERSNFQQDSISRFGLCLVNTAETDDLFNDALIYQPEYFPEGMSIDVIPNIDTSQLPWTFRLPFRGGKKTVDEPIIHPNKINRLTKVEFGLLDLDFSSQFMQLFEKEESITFSQKDRLDLTLEFDFGKQ